MIETWPAVAALIAWFALLGVMFVVSLRTLKDHR